MSLETITLESLDQSLEAVNYTQSTLQIEVSLLPDADCRPDSAEKHVETYLKDNYRILALGTIIREFEEYMTFLKQNVSSISIVEVNQEEELVRLEHALLDIHVYQMHDTTTQLSATDSEDETINFATCIDLPASSLDGSLEALIFDDDLKTKILKYISTMMLFASKKVNPHIISSNRLVLLHGPPGTGKTSLCRALAQKISLRLPSAKLIELNACSLFSRFFSESSKQVILLFTLIKELSTSSFIILVIDEVESLTQSRSSSNDPGDAMRVVNVLLTQLDSLRIIPNILVLTTSNDLSASDVAFVDRADIVQFIPPPGPSSSMKILESCFAELLRCELIDAMPGEEEMMAVARKYSEQGYSGRQIRKAPVLHYRRDVSELIHLMNS